MHTIGNPSFCEKVSVRYAATRNESRVSSGGIFSDAPQNSGGIEQYKIAHSPRSLLGRKNLHTILFRNRPCLDLCPPCINILYQQMHHEILSQFFHLEVPQDKARGTISNHYRPDLLQSVHGVVFLDLANHRLTCPALKSEGSLSIRRVPLQQPTHLIKGGSATTVPSLLANTLLLRL